MTDNRPHPLFPSVIGERNNQLGFYGFVLIILILIVTALMGQILYSMIFQEQDNNKFIFEKIAEHVANDYEYSVHIYDCSEFSNELFNRLIYAGYDKVRIEGGCMPDVNNTATADYDECHAWVVLTLGNEEIFIESVTGEIKTKQYYRKKFPYIYHIVKSSEVIIDEY